MTAGQRGLHHDTEVLIRQVDTHLAALRTAPGPLDVSLAERLAATLRALVRATATASATDRARVRAAVHYFVLRRVRGQVRALGKDLSIVNGTARQLGRDDLVVAADGQVVEVA